MPRFFPFWRGYGGAEVGGKIENKNLIKIKLFLIKKNFFNYHLKTKKNFLSDKF